MQEAGAWLVPTYDGATYLDKPAFFFKAVALSLAVFGNNETAARIPSAATSAGLVLLAFAFCRRLHGTRCALLATIVIATTPLYVANARTVIFDMMLALFVCGAIFAGYLAELSEGTVRRNWYLAGAGSAGLATLVKGPVGFVLPTLVLLVFNRFDGRAGAWKRLFSPLNLLVVLAITLPWFIGLCVSHPDFLRYGLWDETFKRFTSGQRFHRAEPFYFYIPIVAATFLPWSLLLPEAMVATWKERWLRNSADRLCVCWAVVVIGFFSISQSKLPGYILSATVACGILVARLLDSAWTAPDGRAGRLVRRATALSAAICLLVGLVGLAAGATHMQGLAKPLKIPLAEAQGLYQAAVPVLVVLAVSGAFGAFAFLRHNLPLCFLSLTLFPLAFGLSAFTCFSVIFEAKSARRLANDFSTCVPASTELACLECFPCGLPFYLGRTLTVFSTDGRELTSNYIVYSIGRTGKWPAKILPVTELDGWLNSHKDRPLYLIASGGSRENLRAVAAAAGAKLETLPSGYVGARLGQQEGR